MIDAVNRVVLALIGLVVLAAAVTGLLAARDLVLIADPATLFARAQTALRTTAEVMALTAAAGLVIAALALWWVSRQITPPVATGIDTLTIHDTGVVHGSANGADPAPTRGSTTLDADAVARVVAADFARLPGVDGAGCRLLTAGARPRLRVRAEVYADADLDGVRRAAEEVYGRLCRVLGVESVHAEIELRPRDRPRERVM